MPTVMIEPNSTTQTRRWSEAHEPDQLPDIPKSGAAGSTVTLTEPVIVEDDANGRILSVVQTLEAPFIVLRPMQIVIEDIDGSFVAVFEEANVSASGDTWPEALSNLKDYIVDVYDELNVHPEALGPGLRRDFEALQQFVGKRLNARQR